MEINRHINDFLLSNVAITIRSLYEDIEMSNRNDIESQRSLFSAKSADLIARRNDIISKINKLNAENDRLYTQGGPIGIDDHRLDEEIELLITEYERLESEIERHNKQSRRA